MARIGRMTALAAVGVLMTATPAAAQSDDGAVDSARSAAEAGAQHGGEDGHLAPVQEDVDLVSKLRLSNVEPGGIADVAVFGDYAYVAAWGFEVCENTGVHVVDISDLANPVEVGFIKAHPGSYPGEGVQVVSIDTPAFTGDVLLTNNEICNENTGFGGINLYDVTDPLNPKPLEVGFGDAADQGNPKKSANETHSVFAWDAGDKAYTVMVDNEEATDLDVVDITNPKKPVLVAEYDLAAEFPGILQPDQGLDEVFLHDVVVKEIEGRFVMIASYWDAGYVVLDVTDPLNPAHLADSDFATPDPLSQQPPEGNAHYADFTVDNGYIIGADEDFDPYAISATNVTDQSALDVSSGSDTPGLEQGQTLSGDTVFVGRACPGDAAVPPAPDTQSGSQIAVVERGVCEFTVKVQAVQAAGGYEGILVFNREGSDACNATLGMTVAGNTPTFGVAPREQGYAIFGVEDQFVEEACLAGDGSALAPIAVGAVGDVLAFSSYFDGWGYVRLFDPETMEELDRYAIPEAFEPDFANDFGDLSVHEVAPSQVDPNLAYLSYYSGGLRVIDVSDGEITEVGAFIDEGGNNFWGVETIVRDGVEYVVMSDRDFGLYILRYPGRG